MATDRIPIGYFKVLEYANNYNSFDHFYSEHKAKIYETIVEVFEEFKTTTKAVLTVRLRTTIGGVLWDSEFGFTKDQYFILKRDILPFFEVEENYEMCSRIMKVYNEIVTC